MPATEPPLRRSSRSVGAPGAFGFAVLGALTLVAVLLVAVVALLAGWNPWSAATVDRSAPVVLEQLRDLARYKAASGDFSELVDVEDDAGLLPDFVAGQRTLLIAVGTVDAEVDFSRLGGEYVTVSADGKGVEIRLPPAELSEPRLDFDRTHVVNRDRGIINRLSEVLSSNARDDQVLYQRATGQIGAAAEQTQLRQRAEENTALMLTSLLRGLGYEHVTVSFDAPRV